MKDYFLLHQNVRKIGLVAQGERYLLKSKSGKEIEKEKKGSHVLIKAKDYEKKRHEEKAKSFVKERKKRRCKVEK